MNNYVYAFWQPEDRKQVISYTVLDAANKNVKDQMYNESWQNR